MTTIVKVGAVILITTVATVYVYKKGYIGRRTSKKENKIDSKPPGDGSHPQNSSDGCSKELYEIARDFGFLYERTYLLLNGMAGTEEPEYLISEWETRIKTNSKKFLLESWKSIINENFHVDFYKDSINPAHSNIFSTLKKWFDFLIKLGINRDSRAEIIVKDNSIHHTYFIDELWKINDVLTVVQPAWFLDGKYIEKGRAKVKHL